MRLCGLKVGATNQVEGYDGQSHSVLQWLLAGSTYSWQKKKIRLTSRENVAVVCRLIFICIRFISDLTGRIILHASPVKVLAIIICVHVCVSCALAKYFWMG